MKLTVEPQPEAYTADKAVTLTDETGEIILISCPNASLMAAKIAARVNRFDAMVAVLTPFRSTEMGQLLLDHLLNDAPSGVTEEAMNVAHARMKKLINAVDVILKSVELAKEREDELSGTSTRDGGDVPTASKN